MSSASKMLIWFAMVSALSTGAIHESNAEKNLVEVWSSWNTIVKQYERLIMGENDTDEKPRSDNEMIVESEADRRLRDLRVQSVQNQILRKLRLRDRPWPAATVRRTLPLPVREGATMQLSHLHEHELQDPHSDDFYGKTDQKVVFPDDVPELGKCDGYPYNHHANCFTFNMPGDLQPEDVSSAELWIYKMADPYDKYNQTFIVAEATHWDYTRQFRKFNPVAIHETHLYEGWIKIDVSWVASRWLEATMAAIEISCMTCGAPLSATPLSLDIKDRPFLVFNTKYNTKKRRVRHLECTPGISECCRERLYVSFAELGWDDWILQPPGYNAYFCRGSCNSVAAVTLSGSHHNSVIKKLFHSNNPRRLELKPCCTPTTFSSLQLFYMDSNKTVTQKTLPNMIVESCGCM